MDVFARHQTLGVANERRDGYLGETEIVGDAREAVTQDMRCHIGQRGVLEEMFRMVREAPDAPLDPLRREFIKYTLSKDGQTETEAGGFYSITNGDRESDLKGEQYFRSVSIGEEAATTVHTRALGIKSKRRCNFLQTFLGQLPSRIANLE
jgi:hypothetical protein